jgi:flagellar biosynthesis protein FlhF
LISTVRTFRAATLHEALERVKRELGKDALILGTRYLEQTPLGRLAKTARVEITAALPAAGLQAHARANAPSKTVQPVAADSSRNLPQAQPSAPAGPTGPHTQVASTGQSPQPPDRRLPELPEEVYPYYVRLIQNEVSAELATRLLQLAAAEVPKDAASRVEAIREALCRHIERMIPGAGLPPVTQGNTHRIALVGPPGGGKTTTLVKLAAYLKLRKHRRVGILCLDTQRPAAAEQLRRYAEAIQVPLETAQTREQVQVALKRLNDVQHILIDTAGVGYREAGRFARLASLLHVAKPDEVHLVLPASMASSAQLRAAAGFAPLRVNRLVITHLDEAVGAGVILNLVDRLHWAVSYICQGQNVPQDLEPACGRRLAELILSSEG